MRAGGRALACIEKKNIPEYTWQGQAKPTDPLDKSHLPSCSSARFHCCEFPPLSYLCSISCSLMAACDGLRCSSFLIPSTAHWVKCFKFYTARQNLPPRSNEDPIPELYPESLFLFAQRNKIPCPKCWHSGLALSKGIKEMMAQWWFPYQADPDLIWCSTNSCSYDVTEDVQMFHSHYTEFPPGIWFVLGCCPDMMVCYPFQYYFSAGNYGKIYRDSVSTHFLSWSLKENGKQKKKKKWTHVEIAVLVSPENVATMSQKLCLWWCHIVCVAIKRINRSRMDI